MKYTHVIINDNVLLTRYWHIYKLHTHYHQSQCIINQTLTHLHYTHTLPSITTIMKYTHIIGNHNILLTRYWHIYEMHTHHHQSQYISNNILTHLLNAHTLLSITSYYEPDIKYTHISINHNTLLTRCKTHTH